MSQTRVQFIECADGNYAVVVLNTTLRGGLVAHLVDTFSRLRFEVHKVESRLDREGWVQRLVVAAARGETLDRSALDELKAAVFATIEAVGLGLDETDEASSGTFAVAPSGESDIESTG